MSGYKSLLLFFFSASLLVCMIGIGLLSMVQ